MDIEQLEKQLSYTKKSGWETLDYDSIQDFSKGYIDFLNKAKTEREIVEYMVEAAKSQGFLPLDSFKALKAGDKVCYVNKNKAILLAVIGEDMLKNGFNIIASHIDSPRLDLKQNPLVEESGLAMLKTHYYGGIKKYQWLTIPLALHGVVMLSDGTRLTLTLGDDEDDYTFTISDLLPHLASEQMEKTMSKAVEGENLQILFGNIPLKDAEKKPVKLAILQKLNQDYGMIEEDFVSAELEAVPAIKAKSVGLDRSMIGAPGHDDRVCAYTSFKAIMEVDQPAKTAVCLFFDKEEIGSMGVSGAKSKFFENAVDKLCKLANDGVYDHIQRNDTLEQSVCISADVSCAIDPCYKDVSDEPNASLMSYGVSLLKYSGSRGKSGSSDASCELMHKIRMLLNENGIPYQPTELGKVDKGGGGTVAQFLANLNIDTVDLGVPILSMHSPFEVCSKADVYAAYMTYKALLKS